MEGLINELSDTYTNVKYHECRENHILFKSALNDMIGTCTMIIKKCNDLKNMMYD